MAKISDELEGELAAMSKRIYGIMIDEIKDGVESDELSIHDVYSKLEKIEEQTRLMKQRLRQHMKKGARP